MIAVKGFCIAIVAAAGVCHAGEDDPPSPEEIRAWIVQLDDDDFGTRERATQNLTKAGSVALSHVASAIPGGGPEVRLRGFMILRQLALQTDEPTSQQVDAALSKLASSANAKVAEQAANLRKNFKQQRRARAIESIRRLGGSVSINSGTIERVEIRGGWTGGDEGLRHLRSLPDITWISLEDSPITDAGLIHLAELTDLTHLYLGKSQVQGPGLVHIKKLKKLEHLSLRYMPLDDEWLQQVGEIHSLQSLGLDDTQVTDDSVLLLATLPNLQWLWLDRTRVTGAGMTRLKRLGELKMLDLDGLKLKDADLAHLSELPSLETLYLDDTPASDEAFKHLLRMKTLRHLHLRNTKVTEKGVADFEQAMPHVTVTR